MDPILLIHSCISGHLASNTCLSPCFLVFGAIYPEVELLDDAIIFCIFSILRNHHTELPSSCIILPPYYLCTRVPVPPHPHQHFFLGFDFFLNSSHLNGYEDLIV